MIYSLSASCRRAFIVGYPEHNSLLILRAANGRVLRELIYPSSSPDSWDRAYQTLRREAVFLGYEVRESTSTRALGNARSRGAIGGDGTLAAG